MIRFLDIIFSFIGIALLSPLFLFVALVVKLNSAGPIFYRQMRVGKNSSDFSLFKFRTMRVNADQLGLLTVGGRDVRITSVGYFLRKYKLDELPQLWNVLIGDMSLVGPRPEVRKYVNYYSGEQLKVLSIRPGISDWASILYKNENEILEKSTNPEQDYIHKILPDKIRYNMIYIEKNTVQEYLKIIFVTIYRIIFR